MKISKTTNLLFFLTLIFIGQKLNSQIPENALIGYWHNWSSVDVKYVLLDKIDPRYNVIEISFATPTSNSDMTMNFVPEVVSKSELIAQIQLKQSKGKKVLISIGGATTSIDIKDNTQFDNFVSSMNNIIETYGFDGMDIDIEHGNSILITSGSTIASPNNQSMINLINAVKSIMSTYRSKNLKKMLLTMAPETAYVQGGQSGFGSIWGGYLPIIHALRDSLDILQVQLYNSGSMYGIDNNIYEQGSADFIVAMTEAVIHGFNTGGGWFTGLPSHKVAVGLPACANAAGGGFVDTSNVRKALQYLVGKGPKVGSYSLDSANGYKNLSKMMTWSINWDSMSTCGNSYDFANNYEKIFNCSSPIFTSNLENKRVCEDASITFSVNVDGDNLNYKWQYNSNPISNSPNSNVYIIDNVNSSNSGSYSVKVSNSCGKTINSKSSILNVIDKLKLNSNSDDLTTCEGSRTELKVSASGYKLLYQWKKESTNISGERDSILSFQNVTFTDNGEYQCEISDSCGNIINTEVINLKVIKKINLISQSNDTSVCENNSLELSVNIEGNKVRYLWKKDNAELVDENNSTLILNKVTQKDEGNYTCEAVDSCGNFVKSNKIKVEIKGTPEILVDLNDIIKIEGDSLYFEIIAIGENLQYSWYKDDKIIEGKNQSFLKIPNLTLSDSGLYFCTISNECNLVKSKKINLKIEKSITEAKLILLKSLIACDSVLKDKFNSNIFPNIVKNIGESDLIINSIELSGKDNDNYSLIDLTFPIILKKNETLTLKINFLGRSAGLNEAQIIFNSNSNKTDQLQLNGFVIETFFEYPLGIYFDNTDVGSESSQPINIKNYSNIDLKFIAEIEGENCSDLALMEDIFIIKKNSDYDFAINYKRTSSDNPNCNILLKNKWLVDTRIETKFPITDVKELDLSQDILVTPNPAFEEIKLINLPVNSEISIYSIYGKKLIGNIKNHNRIDISNLPPGIYYCEILKGHSINVVNFIVFK